MKSANQITKLKFMKKIKSKIVSLYNKAKKKITTFINTKIIKSYKDKKAAVAKERELKELRNSFEKQFNVKIKDIKRAITTLEKNTITVDVEAERLASIKKMNSKNRYNAFHYNPEVCDMHNENPDREMYPTIRDISTQDSDTVRKLLKEQSEPKTKKINTKAEYLWKTRS